MMATLNAVGRPRSFDATTADHVTTVPSDNASNPIDDKVGSNAPSANRFLWMLPFCLFCLEASCLSYWVNICVVRLQARILSKHGFMCTRVCQPSVVPFSRGGLHYTLCPIKKIHFICLCHRAGDMFLCLLSVRASVCLSLISFLWYLWCALACIDGFSPDFYC